MHTHGANIGDLAAPGTRTQYTRCAPVGRRSARGTEGHYYRVDDFVALVRQTCAGLDARLELVHGMAQMRKGGHGKEKT